MTPDCSRELPTTPGTVVRVGHNIYVRAFSNWETTVAGHVVLKSHAAIADMDWQLYVPAADEPEVVRDRYRDAWLRYSSGLYRLATSRNPNGIGRPLSFKELCEAFGPLTLIDGSPL